MQAAFHLKPLTNLRGFKVCDKAPLLVSARRRWTLATATRRRRATSATWTSNAAKASSGSSWCRCHAPCRLPRRPTHLLSPGGLHVVFQCGPVVNVHVPKDKLTQQHMGFGFVEFRSEDDAQYAIKVRSARPFDQCARASPKAGNRAWARLRRSFTSICPCAAGPQHDQNIRQAHPSQCGTWSPIPRAVCTHGRTTRRLLGAAWRTLHPECRRNAHPSPLRPHHFPHAAHHFFTLAFLPPTPRVPQ